MTESPDPGAEPGHMPNQPVPNRPKQRPVGQDLLTDPQRRRRLGAAFDQNQSLAQAREYDAVRPRYPHQAVTAILQLAQASAHSAPVIADLGAGSGILTRELLAAGAHVHAVEPGATMLQVLMETAGDTAETAAVGEFDGPPLGRLFTHQRPAEDTGMAAASCDVAVAAQAWHWFDPERIQEELRRILVPGGAVAVVGNYLDTSDPWVHRLTRIMRAGDVYRPQWQPRLEAPHFSPVETNTFRHSRSITPEEILRLATTLSSWLAADDAQRARRRENLTWYLFEHLGHSQGEELQLPYLTTLHTARLR
ncbi:class I SAM-dependent methyltransferase [Nesterenkonia massiliensis]|uniref:class I SAM-dependent methyltransferase n=1 Tax=Nesterenkonia massiliensis TaxID=1232429 RepID=UPI0003F5B25B|nr:methyltransferase domain-containing protein [Nesterenkonia massiliensis]